MNVKNLVDKSKKRKNPPVKREMLKVCKEFLRERKADFKGMNNCEIVKWATDLAGEEYANKKYPEGTEMDFDQCDECFTWYVGNHRCECGNRRVILEVDGNLIDGFHVYAEAY